MIGISNQILLLIIGLAIGIIGIILKSFLKSLFVGIIEGVLIVAGLIYIFIKMEMLEIPLAISLLVFGWATFTTVFTRNKNNKKLSNEIVNRPENRQVELNKKVTRLLIDILFTTVLLSLSIIYFIFNPNPIISLILLFGLFQLILEMIKRIIVFTSLRVYYEEELNSLYVLTVFDVKKYPLAEATEIEIHSRVDVLRLFPLFTMFNSTADFTTEMGRTVKISFLGEKVFINIPENQLEIIDRDSSEIGEQKESTDAINEKEVLPFYHRKNLKRLIGKGYFAVTVKGVGAYATLLLILSLLNVEVWITITAIVVFWIFNLLISDRIIKIALDVEKITDEEVLEVGRKIFKRANLPNITLYQTETADFNGFAAGANIGRSIITLTTETLKLPLEAIEGILAHEAIHVKKRDVLIGQLMRFVSMGIVIAIIFLFKDFFEKQTMVLYVVVWILMMIFPAIYSLFTQWMEVRADHLGATLLDDGNVQMANSLKQLAMKQDEAIENSEQYNIDDEKENSSDKKMSSINRDKWFIRLLEFQFFSHPPMYWRIQSLEESFCNWDRKKLKNWCVDRFKESIPDKVIKYFAK